MPAVECVNSLTPFVGVWRQAGGVGSIRAAQGHTIQAGIQSFIVPSSSLFGCCSCCVSVGAQDRSVKPRRLRRAVPCSVWPVEVVQAGLMHRRLQLDDRDLFISHFHDVVVYSAAALSLQMTIGSRGLNIAFMGRTVRH
jgi:hypothetical protein